MPAPGEVKAAGGVTQEGGLGNPAEVLWNLIIRPPRSRYSVEQLGPKHFCLERRAFVRRTDVQLKNPRGHALECSLFEPLPQTAWDQSRQQAEQHAGQANGSGWGVTPGKEAQEDVSAPWAQEAAPDTGAPALPCVVFLHGNSSCRLEAAPLVQLLMPLSISLFCFDFSGCGLSEGEYISLGWFERDDLALCIDYLRSLGRVSQIAIWGRSMGAFTALLHADRDPSIAGLVLDSPFTSLTLLAEELARHHAKVPAWMVRAVLTAVRGVIQVKAGFDIDKLNAFDHVGCSFSPALFIAANGDDFILPHHAQELHDAYQGEKDLHFIPGDHNSARPEACRRKAALFLCRTFHDAKLDQLLDMHTSGLFDIFTGQAALQQLAVDGQITDGMDCSDEGKALCQQMQVFPSLRRMMLIRETNCRRPFITRTTIRLLQESSEAGFFVRLEPAVDAVRLQGIPHMLVVTISAGAVVISRVCDDALETVAATGGIPVRVLHHVVLSMARSGRLLLQVEADAHDLPENVISLEMDCGGTFREQVKLWVMLLSGQTSFGQLAVEDGEATLRENLGDALLGSRHLGGTSVASRPALMPRGDSGLTATRSSPNDSARTAAAAAAIGGLSSAQVLDCCASQPEALVGWRVRISSLGDCVVVGVRRRWGRSTQHLICTTPTRLTSVVLRRKDSHHLRRQGLEFEVLERDF